MGVLKNFDCSTHKKDYVGTSGGDWTIIHPGLSYCGTCKQRDCAACHQNVVMFRGGSGTFVVNDDISTGESLRCPMCRSAVPLAYVALFRCRAAVTVLRHEEESTELVAKGDEIIKINSEGQNQINTEALVTIKVKSHLHKSACAIS